MISDNSYILYMYIETYCGGKMNVVDHRCLEAFATQQISSLIIITAYGQAETCMSGLSIYLLV